MTVDRTQTWSIARFRCQAKGLHHRDCPGEIHPATVNTFSVHHRYPKERAKRDGFTGDIDAQHNLLAVWNGTTGLGAGGCHGRIHSERRKAKDLGLLLDDFPV